MTKVVDLFELQKLLPIFVVNLELASLLLSKICFKKYE